LGDKEMKLKTAILAVLLLGFGNDAAGVSPFYEDEGACPFECCTYREWTATELTVVHENRDSTSGVVFSLQPDEKVIGITGVVVTVEPGVAVVTRPLTVTCGAESLTARPGETFDLLHYEGEGFFKFKFRGRLCSGDVPWPTGTEKEHGSFGDRGPVLNHIRTESLPKTVWWVNLKNRAGKTGWSNEPDHFAHVDACE
jgi:hypothetical protein